MRWKVAASTVTGKSHIDRGEKGQDFNKAGTIQIGEEEYFIGIVSDGAGSTTDGGRGAEITCETAFACITGTVRDTCVSEITDKTIQVWISVCHDAIVAEATKRGKRLRDFACTVIGIVAGNGGVIFFQIGDGAIVTRCGDEYAVIFWPEQGEYVNTTYFVTDEEFQHSVKISRSGTIPIAIAAFTDGLQNLVLSFAQKSPHPGFFRPLFEALQSSSDDTCPGFSAQLGQFLNRDDISARSDDDRTLVLAVRQEG